MLDHLHIHIPFRRGSSLLKRWRNVGYVSRDGLTRGRIEYAVNMERLAFLGVSDVYGQIVFNDDYLTVDKLSCPWESMPTSFTPLAFKIEDKTSEFIAVPGIVLKGSPAKIMQGHNVYGPSSIELGFKAFIWHLSKAYPALIGHLDLENVEVYGLDVTYSARLKSEQMVSLMLQNMRGVSYGQTKARGSSHQNTAYWGSKLTQTKAIKIYNKHNELNYQIKQYKKKSSNLGHIVPVLENVKDYAKCLLRCEVTIKKKFLAKLGVANNINALIKHQNKEAKNGNDFLFSLWEKATSDLFAAFKNDKLTIDVCDDEAVYNALIKTHQGFTKSGKVTYAKAKRLFNFYRTLRDYGFDNTKDTTTPSTFYRNLSELSQSGLSRSTLRELYNLKKGYKKRVLKFEELDFKDQLPNDYQMPSLAQYELSPEVCKEDNSYYIKEVSKASLKSVLVSVEAFERLGQALDDKAQLVKIDAKSIKENQYHVKKDLAAYKVPTISGDLYLMPVNEANINQSQKVQGG